MSKRSMTAEDVERHNSKVLQAKAPKRGRVGPTSEQFMQKHYGPPGYVDPANTTGDARNVGDQYPPKRSKHGAVKTIRHGIRFDSKHEADVYDDLLLRQKAGEIRNLQRQVRTRRSQKFMKR